MKLFSSIKKEFILATRSFYFYVEVGFAFIILAVLLFAVPKESTAMQTSYTYLDMPQHAADIVIESMLEDDTDGKLEAVTLEVDKVEYHAQRVEREEEYIYILESADDLRTLADKERNIGAIVLLSDTGELQFEYYFQGYESTRLKNLISVLHNIDSAELEQSFNAQEVTTLSEAGDTMNNRENTLPPVLTFSSCLMGMFILAAYVFLDKEEGVIKAYAVTASSVSRYLMSKITIVLLTSVVTSLIILIPIMAVKINYGLMLLLLITSGFFSSVIGFLLASFYDNIEKAFGMIFVILMLMMLPAISYFLPGWNPVWVKYLPSYPIIQGFKEILTNGSVSYPIIASAGFLTAGAVLFIITDRRFRKSLSV